jgi:hypothetical protein
MTVDTLKVALEIGTRRVFARALDWPGWCRSARDEDGALAALTAYGPRYAAVAAAASAAAADAPDRLEVVERIPGDATTDFGAPGRPSMLDATPLTPAEIDRLVAILRSCWAAFDRVAAGAAGVELTKGPRGGGRDVDRIVDHVNGAEQSYLVQLGARAPQAPAAVREVVVATLLARARGEPVEDPSGTRKPWTPRYFAHRAAWHVLDHAWEIEDRSAR